MFSLPALVLVLWWTATLSWWAFAFMPVPSAPPEWLTTARSACFGTLDNGLPAFHGWILLVLAPASFLTAIVVLWGAELPDSLRQVARSRAGAVIAASLIGAALVEGAWVSGKVRVAAAVGPGEVGIADGPPGLPAAYPRRTAPAPEFTLVDQHGEQISRRRLQGRPVILTFVFAHCQTLCPVLVQTIKSAVSGGAGSEVLMVTLDPWRDTPEALPGLARRWDLPPNFHVLSSRSIDDVLSVARAFDVPSERNLQTGDIVHPGLVFVIDPGGRIAYTFNNPPPRWIRDGLDRLG